MISFNKTLAALAAASLFVIPAVAANHSTHGAIGAYHAQHRSTFGQPTSPEFNHGGNRWSQNFEKGIITFSFRHGIGALQSGATLDRYRERGGAEGSLGLVVGREYDSARGSRVQRFEHGVIVSRAGTAWAVARGMHGGYATQGGERGPLGLPTSNEYPGAGGVMRQNFQNGTLFWSASIGAVGVRNGIHLAYSTAGSERSRIGLPTSWEYPVAGGYAQNFQHGRIFWSPRTSAHPVIFGMNQYYSWHGSERSQYGYPTASEQAVPGGFKQTFQNGALFWVDSRGAVSGVRNGMWAHYSQLGAEHSVLGLPTSDEYAYAGSYVQHFEHGVLLWHPRTGAASVTHEAFRLWERDPQRFGPATRDAYATAEGHVLNSFERENIYADGQGVHSTEMVTGGPVAVLLGDSQLDWDSWVEQGVRGNGFATVERAYGGVGYAAGSGWLGDNIPSAYHSDQILLPRGLGADDLIVLTLGGNDASQGRSDAEIIANFNLLVNTLQERNPGVQIVVNGVMSRDDASHARRREIDQLVTSHARALGIPAISVAGWGSSAQYADYVHLTQHGHNQMGQLYTQKLREVLAAL